MSSSTPSESPASELIAILSGLIGGGRYGLKIRFPHALVMTSLFRRDLSSKDKMQTIIKLTREHATNLAAFAALYKTILSILKLSSKYLQQDEREDVEKAGILQSLGRILVLTIVGPTASNSRSSSAIPRSNPGIPETSRHALIAGAIGGYAIWGRYSSINYQIILYLTSRIIVGGLTFAREHGIPPFCWKSLNFDRSYRLAAAAVWGIVMLLFEECPDVLHPSLRKSMEEIYRYVPPIFKAGDTGEAEEAPSSSSGAKKIRLPPSRLETKNWPY
mmetsp:Transcript_25482/g.55133  ORF Transcript_25482/g.55133 Transcript_25482/m.55133 type:complete len:275 (+) Transcript_25482:226-1050(+)